MNIRVAIFLSCFLVSTVAIADPRIDFEQAQARWQSHGISRYSFNYRTQNVDLVATRCGGAVIRVRVAPGNVFRPIVVKGIRGCGKGTSGRALDVEVPRSIDDLFERMRHWIYNPPTRVNLDVTYDPQYGLPLRWSAVKPEISDSDEGFAITDFEITK